MMAWMLRISWFYSHGWGQSECWEGVGFGSEEDKDDSFEAGDGWELIRKGSSNPWMLEIKLVWIWKRKYGIHAVTQVDLIRKLGKME